MFKLACKAALSGAAILCASAVFASPLDDAKAAMDALNSGDNAAAVRLFTKALSSKGLSRSDRELAYLKRAEAYAAENENAKAEADVNRALQLDPKDQEALALKDKLPESISESEQTARSPTLDETLNFISAKVSQEPVAGFAVQIHDPVANSDWTVRLTTSATNVTPDPKSCRITYHWKTTSSNGTPQEKDAGIAFNEVTNVDVLTEEDIIARIDATLGYPGRSYQAAPPTFVVFVRRGPISNSLYFTDRDLATRVARAVAHAAKLCGGLKPEAF